MAGTRKLVIEILGNAKDAAAAFGDVRKQSEITKERLDRFGTAALGAGVAIAGGLAFAVKEFVAADEQSRKLDNSIKNSTNSFSRGGDAIRELTTELQNLSGADGDALVGASALAVQWGLTESQISQLLPLVNDLSLKMGVDVNSAMKAVLRSTDGSSTALRKMGIDVDAAKLAADPFSASMDALKGSVGGFGEEVGKTAGGQLNILKQQLGDLVEAVGGGALDVFGPVISGLTNFINGAGPAGQAAGDMAGKVLAVGSAGLIAVGGIVKIAGAVSSAKDALTNADGALNNFGKAAQGIGIAVAGIGTAFALWQVGSVINDATKDTIGFETAVNNLKTALSFDDRAQEIANMANATQGLRDKYFDFLATVSSGGSSDNPLSRTFTLGDQKIQLDAMKDGLEKMRASGDMTGVASTIGFLRDNAKGSDRAMADLNKILLPFEKNAKSAAGAAKAQADAHNEAANAADEQNAALKALTDPVFGAMRAQQQNTAAQEKYAEAQNKVTFLMAAGKAGSGQLAQAQRELQSASIDAGSSAVNQQAALASLGGAMANGTVSASGLNATLSGLVSSGQLSAGAALQLAASFNNGTAPAARDASGKLLGVTAAANTIPSSKSTTVTADTSQAEASIRNLVSKYGPIIGVWRALGGGIDGNPATPQATGGTVLGDRPYLVGERGPEVIVPGSGYVIPTRRLVDAPTGGGGTGGGAITVNVTAGVGDPVAIGRTVVETLKAYERTNGTAWRN